MKNNDKNAAPKPQEIISEKLQGSSVDTAKVKRSAGLEAGPAEPWSRAVARRIAREETGVSGATLADTLAGPRIRLASEEARLSYRDRCCNRAADLGHPVQSEEDVLNGPDNTVCEVGDSLYDSSNY
jgi:hypothetical protein